MVKAGLRVECLGEHDAIMMESKQVDRFLKWVFEIPIYARPKIQSATFHGDVQNSLRVL